MIDLDGLKKEGYTNALIKEIESKCERVVATTSQAQGVSPSDLDRCETRLKDALALIAELKKLQ